MTEAFNKWFRTAIVPENRDPIEIAWEAGAAWEREQAAKMAEDYTVASIKSALGFQTVQTRIANRAELAAAIRARGKEQGK